MGGDNKKGTYLFFYSDKYDKSGSLKYHHYIRELLDPI